MGTQNICLLLKLVHRLHCPESSARAQWVQGRASISTLNGDIHGEHWQGLTVSSPPIGHHHSQPWQWEILLLLIRRLVLWYGDEALANCIPDTLQPRHNEGCHCQQNVVYWTAASAGAPRPLTFLESKTGPTIG